MAKAYASGLATEDQILVDVRRLSHRFNPLEVVDASFSSRVATRLHRTSA